jgi:hypothetical protein
MVEQGGQPAARVAPVHQQQVAAAEQVEVLEQHLPFILVDGCRDAASISSAPGRYSLKATCSLAPAARALFKFFKKLVDRKNIVSILTTTL